MNPEIKARWIAALRSGEYKQGQNKLSIREPGGTTTYCCLGVLCDLAAKEGIGGWVGDKPLDFEAGGVGSTYSPPSAVTEWAGLSHRAPNEEYLELSTRNDDGRSFPELADYIEEHL